MERMSTRTWWAIGVLVATHVALCVIEIGHQFITVDEVGHVPSGLSHWRTGTFWAYRVNPPLPRMWATLPLLLSGARTDFSQLRPEPSHRSEWFLGQDFIRINGPRSLVYVRISRLANLIWSIITAVVIFAWARILYGETSALFALLLWCVEPTVRAFAGLAVPDMAATATSVLTVFAFWLYLRRPRLATATIAGLLLGLAVLCKFTNLVLFGVLPLLAITTPHRRTPARDWTVHLRDGIVMVAASLLVINCGYGFQGTCQPVGSYRFVSELLRGENERSVNRFDGSWIAALPLPLPADMIRGIDVQRGDFEAGLPSYLLGRWRHRGWWYYYIVALAVKLPLGLIALVFWNVILILVPRATVELENEAATILPALAYLIFVSSQTGFNHHLRYLLPAFPFVFISTAGLVRKGRLKSWVSRIMLISLILWTVASSLLFVPHSISYFNEAVGGPGGGHSVLVDSNIDWGQDLLDLKAWLDQHPDAHPLGFVYFNNRIDPVIFGVEFNLPPPASDGIFMDDPRHVATVGPHPGWFAVSVNYLRGMPFLAPNGSGGYRVIDQDTYSYFQMFAPVTKVGTSIYIYKLTSLKQIS